MASLDLSLETLVAFPFVQGFSCFGSLAPSGYLLLFDEHHSWRQLELFRVYTHLPHTPVPGNKASALPNLLSIGQQLQT